MAVGQKGLTVEDCRQAAAAFMGDAPSEHEPSEDLAAEHEVSEDLAQPNPFEESNYGAMCIAISESGLVSRKCRDCKGRGSRELDEKRKEKWERRIAEAESPTVRAQLRMDRAEEMLCKSCAGSGKVVMERTRAASPCDECDGLGDVHGNSCKRCLGRGFVFLGPVDYRAVTTVCGRCKGCGEVRNEDLQDVCQLCRGDGYTIPCTVFEKGSTKKGKLPPGYEGGSQVETVVRPAGVGGAVAWADEQEISELGTDSTLLEKVRQRDPLAATVLETYLGPEGLRWSHHHFGKEFSVWQHTPSGKRIIEESFGGQTHERAAVHGAAYKRGAGYLARPSDIIARERSADTKAKVPNVRTRALLKRAAEESREMLARAQKVLVEVAAAA